MVNIVWKADAGATRVQISDWATKQNVVNVVDNSGFDRNKLPNAIEFWTPRSASGVYDVTTWRNGGWEKLKKTFDATGKEVSSIVVGKSPANPVQQSQPVGAPPGSLSLDAVRTNMVTYMNTTYDASTQSYASLFAEQGVSAVSYFNGQQLQNAVAKFAGVAEQYGKVIEAISKTNGTEAQLVAQLKNAVPHTTASSFNNIGELIGFIDGKMADSITNLTSNITTLTNDVKKAKSFTEAQAAKDRLKAVFDIVTSVVTSFGSGALAGASISRVIAGGSGIVANKVSAAGSAANSVANASKAANTGAADIRGVQTGARTQDKMANLATALQTIEAATRPPAQIAPGDVAGLAKKGLHDSISGLWQSVISTEYELGKIFANTATKGAEVGKPGPGNPVDSPSFTIDAPDRGYFLRNFPTQEVVDLRGNVTKQVDHWHKMTISRWLTA